MRQTLPWCHHAAGWPMGPCIWAGERRRQQLGLVLPCSDVGDDEGTARVCAASCWSPKTTQVCTGSRNDFAPLRAATVKVDWNISSKLTHISSRRRAKSHRDEHS